MRLWHEALIPYLPRQQLLGQHRECCALRGNGWGKPHATVNYVFKHDPMYLSVYHYKVMAEMVRRGYTPDKKWYNPLYRGENCLKYQDTSDTKAMIFYRTLYGTRPVYPEHNDEYLKECLENLAGKGIVLEVTV